jgi:hypothetical protein
MVGTYDPAILSAPHDRVQEERGDQDHDRCEAAQ